MIEIIGFILIFIAGLFVGSFLNVISDRVPYGESPVKGRSKCPHCRKNLGPKDLIPLLSFILLKGKCRQCGKKLSLYYPLAEIMTGLSFVSIAFLIGVFGEPNPFIWLTFAYFAVVASFLIVLFLTDVKYKIIPNKVVFPAIWFMLLFMVGGVLFISITSYLQLKADPFGRYLLEVGYWQDQIMFLVKNLGMGIGSALLIGAFFWFLIWITKGKGMGGGDVKLAFLIGLINGFPLNIVAIVLAFVTGALYSGVLMMFKKKGMKDVIPFGPFLILGSVVAFGFGQQIFNWYIGLL